MTVCISYGTVYQFFQGNQVVPTDSDGDTMIHYENEKYDIFWKTVQDLDILVYMHPRLVSPTIAKQLWNDRPGWDAQIFSTGVSIHTPGLVVTGFSTVSPKPNSSSVVWVKAFLLIFGG